MIGSLRTLNSESPISRLHRYMESLGPKVDMLIRAQSKTGECAVKQKSMPRDQCIRTIIEFGKRGSPLMDICVKVNRTRTFVRRQLALAGVDFRHLSKPFSKQESGTEELGIKFRELLKAGTPYHKAVKMLGVKERVAGESLAMVGGLK